jgi:hypothetical protein
VWADKAESGVGPVDYVSAFVGREGKVTPLPTLSTICVGRKGKVTPLPTLSTICVGRRGRSTDLGTLKGHGARSFWKPLVPTDGHSYLGKLGVEYFESRVPYVEVHLL